MEMWWRMGDIANHGKVLANEDMVAHAVDVVAHGDVEAHGQCGGSLAMWWFMKN